MLGLRIYIYIKQERKKLQKQYGLLGQVKTVQQVDVRLASTLTRSTGGALTGKPECELDRSYIQWLDHVDAVLSDGFLLGRIH